MLFRSIVGDLEEQYARRVRSGGRLRAAWRYLRDAVASATIRRVVPPPPPREPAPGPIPTRSGGVEALVEDVRAAVRSLVRRPAFALVASATLALGTGAAAAVFGMANDVLLRLNGEANGTALADEIEARAGRAVSPGALYTVLDRLESKRLVESWIGGSTPERGGRRRKVYRLQPEGARELRDWWESVEQMTSGMLGRLDDLAEGK